MTYIDPKYIIKHEIEIRKLQKEMREYIRLKQCKQIIICKQGIIVYIEYTLSKDKEIFTRCILFKFKDVEINCPVQTLFDYLTWENIDRWYSLNVNHIHEQISIKMSKIIEFEKEVYLYKQFQEKMIYLKMLKPQKVGKALL
jgi:hypothetical protein